MNKKYQMHHFYFWFSEFILGESLFSKLGLSRLKKNNQKKIKERFLEREKINPRTPTTLSNFDSKEINKYIKRGMPFILKGVAKQWPACQKWSFDFFQKNYGEITLPFTDEYLDEGGSFQQRKISDIIKEIDNGSHRYARFANIVHQQPELQKDFFLDCFRSFMPTRASHFTAYQFFLGGKNTSTPLHCAPTSNFFVQVYGQKEWLIFSPKFNPLVDPRIDRTPYFRSGVGFDYPYKEAPEILERMDRFQFTLEPGDVLYNPPFYWHYVYNLSSSIGMSFKWTSPLNSLKASKSLFFFTLISTNPSIFKAYIRAKFKKNHLLKWYEKK